MGAAGPARALPHKPAGQRHRSGLVGMSSGSRPELVQTALGGKQGISLGKEKESGGLLCSTAEKGMEAVEFVGGGGPGCLFESSLTAKVSSDGGPV